MTRRGRSARRRSSPPTPRCANPSPNPSPNPNPDPDPNPDPNPNPDPAPNPSPNPSPSPSQVRARLRRLRTLGTKQRHEAVLSVNHADDATDLAPVRTGSGAPVTPLRTPLGRAFRKAAAVKGATALAAESDC